MAGEPTVFRVGCYFLDPDRKLRSVEQMPDDEAARILKLPSLSEEIEMEETEAPADREMSDDEDEV